MICSLEKEFNWGIMHAKITHQFKNYVNLTFEDSKYNLCDISVSVTGKYCPLKPGIYHGIYKGTIPSFLWPVNNARYIKVTCYSNNRASIFSKLLAI